MNDQPNYGHPDYPESRSFNPFGEEEPVEPNDSHETRVVIEYGERPYVVKQGEREIKRFARCDEAKQFVSVRRIARHETYLRFVDPKNKL